MKRCTTARTSLNRPCVLDRLEARQMLANFVTTITDTDGDVFQVSAENFTSAPLANITITGGASRVLDISGSTAASDIRISRVSQSGNGRLNLHAVYILSGDIDELTMDNFVDIAPAGAGVPAGVYVQGRARVITIDGTLGAPLGISSTSLANRTTLTINEVNGVFALPRGPGFPNMPITSGGIFERVTIGAAQFISLSARRFGIVDIQDTLGVVSRGLPPTGPGLVFDMTATDAAAPYGVKTLTIRCPVANGTLDSASPVQTIAYEGVTVGFTGPFRGFGLPDLGTFDIDVTGRIDTLKTTDGVMNGTVTAGSIGVLQAQTVMTGQYGNILARGQSAPIGSIDSVRAFSITEALIGVLGGIGQFKADNILGVTVDVGWIGTLQSSVEMNSSSFFMSANVGTRSRALDTATITGIMTSSSITMPVNNIGSMSLTSTFTSGSSIFVGVTNPGALFNFAGSPFGGNFSINSLKLKQPAGNTSNIWSNASIAAPTINSVSSTLFVNNSNASVLFGLVYNNVTTMSLRLPGGSSFTDTSGSASSGDFRVLNL